MAEKVIYYQEVAAQYHMLGCCKCMLETETSIYIKQ